MERKDVYLASKPRYEILDGYAYLRCRLHLLPRHRLAYAALKLYDLPVREWLRNKLFTKSTSK